MRGRSESDGAPSRRNATVLRFDARPGEPPRAHKFFAARQFVEAAPPGKPSFWRRLTGSAPLGGRLSLARILATEQRSVAQPTLAGFQNIELPFADIVLLVRQHGPTASQEDIDYAQTVANRVTDAIWKEWSRYIDPLPGCQARAYPTTLGDAAGCLAFLGEGIFAPRPASAPIGWISISSGAGEAFRPLLPDGEPAALYRGQSQVAFSGRLETTPAVCEALSGLPGAFLARAGRADNEPRCSLTHHSLGDARVVIPDIKAVKPSWGDEGVADAAYEVRLIHEGIPTELSVEICVDARPSRMFNRRQVGPGFEIVGLVEPLTSEGRPVRRWWFDLDRERGGLLCSSALTSACKSVVCKGDSLEIWDWSRPGETTRPNPRELQWRDAARGDEPFRILYSSRPLGFLKAPDRDLPVAYGPSLGGDDFALDWLDFAGAVERTRSETKRWAEGRAEAANDDASTDREDVMLGLSPGAEKRRFWIAPAENLRFSLCAGEALRPGGRLLVAGLILQYFE